MPMRPKRFDPDEGIGGLTAYPNTTLAVARIKRERETAATRYLRNRDLAALEQTMARLDAEEAEANASVQVVLGVQSVTIHPTSEADSLGWSDAFGPEPLLLNAGRSFSTDGRGERI